MQNNLTDLKIEKVLNIHLIFSNQVQPLEIEKLILNEVPNISRMTGAILNGVKPTVENYYNQNGRFHICCSFTISTHTNKRG